jgi:hypothetical protein
MTWLREMASLIRQYFEADRAYRASMRELRKSVKEHGRRLYELRADIEEWERPAP